MHGGPFASRDAEAELVGSRSMISRDGGRVSVMPLDGRAMRAPCIMYRT